MLTCIIDGQQRNMDFNGIYSLGGAIGALNREVARGGKVVASLKIDGAEFYEDEQASAGLDGVQTIEVTTETSVQLAVRVLNEGEAFIDELQQYLKNTSEHFRTGYESKGKDSLVDAVQGLQIFVTMIEVVKNSLNLDFRTIMLDGTPLDRHNDMMNQIFLDMISSQEKGDWVLLSDLLEYELIPQMETWKQIFGMLKNSEHVKAA